MTQSNVNNSVLFATSGYDHTIRFWKADTGTCIRILQHNESQVNCMAIFPDKTLLAAGGYQHVSIYDTVASGQNNQVALFTLDNMLKNIVSVGFQEQGSWMYTAGEDKTVRIYDMKSRHLNCLKMFTHTHPISCAVLHPNQVHFLIGDEVGNLIKWDIRNDNAENIITEPKCAIRSIAINPEGTLMAAVNNEGSCYTWIITSAFSDVNPMRTVLKNTYQPHKRYALKCLFSPDSTRLATSSADGTAKIFRTNDFSLERECKDQQQRWVWDLAFTSDSQYLLTASSDKLARLWDVESGQIKKEYVGHQKLVVCLAFSDSK